MARAAPPSSLVGDLASLSLHGRGPPTTRRRQRRRLRSLSLSQAISDSPGPCGTLMTQLRRRAECAGTLCKILLAHFQVMHVFTQLPSVEWPPAFAKFLEYFSIFSFDFFSVSPLGCTLGFILADLSGFLLLFAIVLIGFSHGLRLASPEKTWLRALQQTYRMGALADAEDAEEFEAEGAWATYLLP